MSINQTAIHNLIENNVSAIRQGIELLTRLSPEHYTQVFQPAFECSIGTHFRHVLEHYRCFFDQLSRGLIQYDERERDRNLETNFVYANESLVLICNQLESFDFAMHLGPLMVRDQQLLDPVPSSIERELLFLHAHTLHHYAMVAAMARSFGVQTAEGFGVAIATLDYYRSESGDRASADG